VPGYDTEVRNIIQRHFALLGEIDQDKTNSLICKKTGDATEPKIMMSGHMDEIGFTTQRITKEGFIKFIPLGGWWDHVILPSESVSRPGSHISFRRCFWLEAGRR